jgi:hypothetical protein
MQTLDRLADRRVRIVSPEGHWKAPQRRGFLLGPRAGARANFPRGNCAR